MRLDNKVICGYIVWLFMACVATTVVYSQEPYQLEMAGDWLYRARATNDLADMAKYLNKSYDIVEHYHGNPAWIFPKPDTDLDLIATNIEECIHNAVSWQNLTEMAYQQAVHNLQETINEIADHLCGEEGGASTWATFTPGIAFMWMMGLWIWLPVWKFG